MRSSVAETSQVADSGHEQRAPLRVLAVTAERGGNVAGLAPLHNMSRWADEAGVELEFVPELPQAVRQLAKAHWDAVLAFVSDNAEEDLTWWKDVLRGAPGSPRLVAVVGRPSMGLVLRAERLGVPDLLSPPLRREDFLRALRRVQSVNSETPLALPDIPVDDAGTALVGQSPAMVQVYQLMARVSPSTATVLIEGESGTGKEVVARAIHQHGPMAAGPFVAVNCAAIPENLLESELFGHEKGSFTGAVARKIGRFEQAAGGTLFLDEIADMSLALQAKILRAVQEREIERVGGQESIPVNVRLAAATNRDLHEAIAQGRFREDLYYRLAVVTIRLPKLVERGEDLLLLTAHFTREFSKRHGKNVRAVSDRALQVLRQHRWVGNVRELRNAIERAVIVAEGDTLRVEHLPEELRGEETLASSGTDNPLLTMAEVEARHIARVLTHTNGHIGAAAQILGMHRNTLARKVRVHGL